MDCLLARWRSRSAPAEAQRGTPRWLGRPRDSHRQPRGPSLRLVTRWHADRRIGTRWRYTAGGARLGDHDDESGWFQRADAGAGGWAGGDLLTRWPAHRV